MLFSIFLKISPLWLHNRLCIAYCCMLRFSCVIRVSFSVLYVALMLPLYKWRWIYWYLWSQRMWGCSYNKGTAYSVFCKYCPCFFFQEEEKLTEIGISCWIPLLSSTVECMALGLSVAFIPLFSAIRFVLFLET